MKRTKLAIHSRQGSFSDQWIAYCQEINIDHKVVNCYDNDIIEQLDDCYALMWHHHHADFTDVLFAKALLFTLEQSGLIVFPDFKTNWHFDDKVGQKYLLEAINAPRIKSYVFYEKGTALAWAKSTDLPKVFKLRGGASAMNVKLVNSRNEILNLIQIAFGKGFAQFNKLQYLSDRYKKATSGADSYVGVLKGIGRLFIPTKFSKLKGREKGYIYFQDFVPNNNFDIRLIVIGDKAYGMKRMTRKDDFRASGSSNFVYDDIPKNVLKIGFEVSKKLGLQSVAFDFVFTHAGEPVIIELSYAYGTKGSSQCPGFWDEDLNWHAGKFNPQSWMVENLISTYNKRSVSSIK